MSPTQSRPTLKLKVIAGLHKDAELLLHEGGRYTIGSGDACDIVLVDSGVEAHHLCFQISLGKVHLLELNAAIFIDGKRLPEAPFFIMDFQVASIGDAHLVFGPVDAKWPQITPPIIDNDASCVTTRELVIVNSGQYHPKKIKPEGCLQRVWRSVLETAAHTNKKLFLAVSTFIVALMIFIGDTWFSYAVLATVEEDATAGVTSTHPNRVSPLLSVVDGFMRVHQNTLMSAGLIEPAVPTETLADSNSDSPVDHIRQVLRNTWGEEKLVEIPNAERGIQFKGYDAHNRQDLTLDLGQDNRDETNAKAITLTARKKKAILSQLNDIIRIKVDVAEDMENVCERVLEKKGVRKPKAQYDLPENTFTIAGQSNDKDTIATVYDIISKAFPDMRVKNDIKMDSRKPAKIDIKAVSTSGLPYVILKDGSKVFNGGKLSNGCTIAGIDDDHILLNCNGAQRKQKL